MDLEKSIFFGDEAKALLLDGMRIGFESLANLESNNPILDTGLSFVREIVQKMEREHNDGAHLATQLLYKLTEQPFEGDLPQFISQLEKEISFIKEGDLINYLTLSKGFPSGVVDCILDAINLAGKHGILIEESLNSDTMIKKTSGLQFQTSSSFPQFEGSLSNPHILILQDPISASVDILPILEQFTKSEEPLVIIADEIDGDALSTLLFYKLEGKINVVVSKMPGFGEARKKHLEEIYHLTGGGPSFLGKASSVHVKNSTLTIVEGENHPLYSIQVAAGASVKMYEECLAKAKSVLAHGVFLDLSTTLSARKGFPNFPKTPIIDAHIALSALKYAMELSNTINCSGALIVESKR